MNDKGKSKIDGIGDPIDIKYGYNFPHSENSILQKSKLQKYFQLGFFHLFYLFFFVCFNSSNSTRWIRFDQEFADKVNAYMISKERQSTDDLQNLWYVENHPYII